MIQGEIMSIFENGSLQRTGVEDTEQLTTSGNWKELNLMFQGIRQVKNSNLCPKTVDLIEQEIPEAASMVRGAVKVSILTPGTVIKPHHGPSNTRMRTHLGIIVPSGCFIRAGDPEEPSHLRQWEEGKLLCFDDSYRHEVWHEGTEPRIILTVDVWHPEMDHCARIAACEDEHQRQVYLARYQLGKDGVGWE
jgi:aspartate beta-hydroxylase